jgi:hypothetical protein
MKCHQCGKSIEWVDKQPGPEQPFHPPGAGYWRHVHDHGTWCPVGPDSATLVEPGWSNDR